MGGGVSWLQAVCEEVGAHCTTVLRALGFHGTPTLLSHEQQLQALGLLHVDGVKPATKGFEDFERRLRGGTPKRLSSRKRQQARLDQEWSQLCRATAALLECVDVDVAKKTAALQAHHQLLLRPAATPAITTPATSVCVAKFAEPSSSPSTAR